MIVCRSVCFGTGIIEGGGRVKTGEVVYALYVIEGACSSVCQYMGVHCGIGVCYMCMMWSGVGVGYVVFE